MYNKKLIKYVPLEGWQERTSIDSTVWTKIQIGTDNDPDYRTLDILIKQQPQYNGLELIASKLQNMKIVLMDYYWTFHILIELVCRLRQKLHEYLIQSRDVQQGFLQLMREFQQAAYYDLFNKPPPDKTFGTELEFQQIVKGLMDEFQIKCVYCKFVIEKDTALIKYLINNGISKAFCSPICAKLYEIMHDRNMIIFLKTKIFKKLNWQERLMNWEYLPIILKQDDWQIFFRTNLLKAGSVNNRQEQFRYCKYLFSK